MNYQILLLILGFTFLIGCSATQPQLGVVKGQLLTCPKSPNCVSSQTSSVDHFIEPFEFAGTAKDAQVRLLQILKTLPQTNILVEKENYIRAEFTSKVFRFIDDVEFYFPVTDTDKVIIHVRSASRVGYSDFGANQQRIEQIRRKFLVN